MITVDKNADLLVPMNLSLQDILIIKENPDYLKANDKDKSEKSKDETENVQSLRSFQVRVFASYDEQMYPIWVEKGSKLTFKVKGNWSLYNEQLFVGSYGDLKQQELVMRFPIGCLLGRVQGGSIFAINHNTEYTATSRGCLYLFQNNGLYETSPKGYLDVSVAGGRQYTYVEIERLSKWPISILNTAYNENLLNQERELVYLINKLRYDPSLFCEHYLNHLVSMSHHYENACKEISSYSKTRYSNNSDNLGSTGESYHVYSNQGSKPKTPVNFSSDIQSENSNTMTNTFKSMKSNNVNEIGEDGKEGKKQKDYVLMYSEILQSISKKRVIMRQNIDTMEVKNKQNEEVSLLEMIKEEKLNCTYYCEICTYGKSSALGILTHLLIDDEDVNNKTNRETLINGNYTHVGVTIKEHNLYGWSCSVVLANLKKTRNFGGTNTGNITENTMENLKTEKGTSKEETLK